jgi:hypothetical protein
MLDILSSLRKSMTPHNCHRKSVPKVDNVLIGENVSIPFEEFFVNLLLFEINIMLT